MNVVVTGSSKGIGKAIADKFGAEGYNLFLCARDEQQLSDTANELQQRYPAIKVHFKNANLSIKEEVTSFAHWCLTFGAPDILVNNAGTYLPGNCKDEPDGNLEHLINTNLYSAYFLTRQLLPEIIIKGKGHIFNMCSVASLHAYNGGGSYSISKFALNGFSQNLRHELKDDKIKVTAVFPGAVFTDSWKNFDNSNGRIMEAADIADMVVAASKLSAQANVEEILLKPVLGDL
ncbi:MAG: SDR family oxidoreductase [Ferruginibacter sp.]